MAQIYLRVMLSKQWTIVLSSTKRETLKMLVFDLICGLSRVFIEVVDLGHKC